jgi:hypothetical protein
VPEKNLLRVGSGKAGETHALVPALAAPDLRVYRAPPVWSGKVAPVRYAVCRNRSMPERSEVGLNP